MIATRTAYLTSAISLMAHQKIATKTVTQTNVFSGGMTAMKTAFQTNVT